MEWPMVAPAPVVTEPAAVFRDLCENQGQFRLFQHDLTGLIVLPNKRMAHRSRGVRDSADNTNVSRVLSEAPWREDAVKRGRLRCLLPPTKPHRRRRRDARVGIDETLCAHVGSLVDDVDRHDNHGDGPYPLAHTPGPSFSVTGPGRFPLGLRLYRRDEDLPQWEAALTKHCPDLTRPAEHKARHRLPTQGAPVVLPAPELRARHAQFRTNSALAIERVDAAIRHNVAFGVVVCDAWSLAEALVQVWARRRNDWISLRNKHRLLETASLQRRDATGWPMKLPGPHLAVAEWVPLMPAHAYRPVSVREQTYGCCTLAGRIPGLGKVRIVVSCEDVQLTGRSIVLGTNRADWDAAKIIRLYLNGGRRQRSLRTVKGPWASTSSACGVSTPLGHSGVWSSWPLRCCT